MPLLAMLHIIHQKPADAFTLSFAVWLFNLMSGEIENTALKRLAAFAEYDCAQIHFGRFITRKVQKVKLAEKGMSLKCVECKQ